MSRSLDQGCHGPRSVPGTIYIKALKVKELMNQVSMYANRSVDMSANLYVQRSSCFERNTLKLSPFTVEYREDGLRLRHGNGQGGSCSQLYYL